MALFMGGHVCISVYIYCMAPSLLFSPIKWTLHRACSTASEEDPCAFSKSLSSNSETTLGQAVLCSRKPAHGGAWLLIYTTRQVRAGVRYRTYEPKHARNLSKEQSGSASPRDTFYSNDSSLKLVLHVS